MVSEYRLGRTPNPDIMCNQEVKFRLFLDSALEGGADMIATGHYAKTKDGQLFRAKDDNKDQTYFLYRVTGEALKRTLFPLGEYTKPEVREMAKTRSLYTAGKKDSQGICFVGQIGVKEFLSQYVDMQPGDVVDKQTGKVLGRHEGAIFYTLGQRHGLGLGGGLPYYVVGKDMERNEVFVTRDLNDGSLWRQSIELSSLHWINEVPVSGDYQVRIRHRAPLVTASVKIQDDGVTVELSEPLRAITAGQSVVLYEGERCLGGGIVS